jgi:hypothetical protein
LIGNDSKVVKLGFKPKLIEKVDFDFHGNNSTKSALLGDRAFNLMLG